MSSATSPGSRQDLLSTLYKPEGNTLTPSSGCMDKLSSCHFLSVFTICNPNTSLTLLPMILVGLSWRDTFLWGSQLQWTGGQPARLLSYLLPPTPQLCQPGGQHFLLWWSAQWWGTSSPQLTGSLNCLSGSADCSQTPSPSHTLLTSHKSASPPSSKLTGCLRRSLFWL